jgi:hypothetical protein
MAVYNVPLSGQTLQNTRASINDNFNNTDTAFTENHVPINTGPNSGKHNLVTMPAQAADPGTLDNEMALYTKLVGGEPQLFLQPFSSGTPLNLTSAAFALPGYTVFPSGMMLIFGNATIPANTAVTNIPLAPYSFPNAILTAWGSPSALTGGNPQDNIFAVAATDFDMITIYRQAPFGIALMINWFAIGY